MKIFFKYFLLFVPTFLGSLISNEIRTVNARTEALPYSLFYVKPSYNTFLILLGLSLPLFFFLKGYFEYGFSFLLAKYTITSITFLAGLWIISKERIAEEIQKAAKIFFWFFFALALIQNTNILVPFNDIFSFFFSKGGLGQGMSYRGASLFYSEYSRASFYVIIIYIIAYGFKIKKTNLLALFALLLLELVLIRSTTGYFLVAGLFLLNFPILFPIFIAMCYFIFVVWQIFNIPSFYHYKIDYLLWSLTTNNFDFFVTNLLDLDGERLTGQLYSLNLIIQNPLGYYFDPVMFEPVSGRIPGSAPILFLRDFGIFSIIYIYIFLKSIGLGSYKSFFAIIFIGAIYSPNASSLVLLAATLEYKRQYYLK